MTSTVMPEFAKQTVALVADDDVHINALISRLLAREGYAVIHVQDGHDAIEEITRRDVDLLVLDLMMPRVDGFGVIAHLQKTRPELLSRTIVVTAFPENELLHAFRSVCTVLAKPFDTAVLIEAVRNCIAR